MFCLPVYPCFSRLQNVHGSEPTSWKSVLAAIYQTCVLFLWSPISLSSFCRAAAAMPFGCLTPGEKKDYNNPSEVTDKYDLGQVVKSWVHSQAATHFTISLLWNLLCLLFCAFCCGALLGLLIPTRSTFIVGLGITWKALVLERNGEKCFSRIADKAMFVCTVCVCVFFMSVCGSYREEFCEIFRAKDKNTLKMYTCKKFLKKDGRKVRKAAKNEILILKMWVLNVLISLLYNLFPLQYMPT